MTNDEVYIDYLMKYRVKRITHNPDELHKIYAQKYANWIVPFLNVHGILDIPPLVCCNTLYRLPDYFGFEGKYFFVSDYYLYDYIYDCNYVFYKLENNEYIYNLWLKMYIENLYLCEDIDKCYNFVYLLEI